MSDKDKVIADAAAFGIGVSIGGKHIALDDYYVDPCPACDGEASRGRKNCNKCNGSGTSRPAPKSQRW